MHKVSSGHFCIDLISDNIKCHVNDVDIREKMVEILIAEKEELDAKTLKKLHHIYGDTSADRLVTFLKKEGKFEKHHVSLLEGIENNCDACIRTKRRRPKPKCSIPRVDKPNEIVTIDLKEYIKSFFKQNYNIY